MTNPPPQNMADVFELEAIGEQTTLESSLQLERLRREIISAINTDPTRIGNLAYALEQCRACLDRQLRHAVVMLADRHALVEQLTARVAYLEGRLDQVERRQQRRWRWW